MQKCFNHFDRIDFNIIVLYELSLQGLLPTASIYRAEVFIHFDRIDFNIIVLYELSLQGSILISTVFVLYELTPQPRKGGEKEKACQPLPTTAQACARRDGFVADSDRPAETETETDRER